MKILFGIVIIAFALVVQVLSWTYDLQEARKFIFEKNDRLEMKRHDEGQSKTEIAKQVYFSNRYDSNSKHHEKPQYSYHNHNNEHDSYAKDYGYQTYMEKKVRDIVHDGSEYLEGLQLSIAHFTELLENCTRINQTNAINSFNETSFNETSFNGTSFNETTPELWIPANERASYNETNFINGTEQCREVTRASEYVRRLAGLAMKAIKDLQDIAYSRKHMKDDPQDLSKEENELILKLAWFLARLAHYTGYRPRVTRYFTDPYPNSTTARPPMPSLMNASEATKLMMMNCLKQKSIVPATIRCAYPQEIPGVVQFLINNTNPMPGGFPSSSNWNEQVVSSPPPPTPSDAELLIATDYRPTFIPYRHLTAVKHVTKRSLQEPEQVLRNKRATEDPSIIFIKYFVNHKIWDSDNPTKPDRIKSSHFEQFDVTNHLQNVIQKRSLDGKLEKTEDPFQDLSKYIKNKKGVNYVKDKIQAQRLRNFIDKLRISKTSTAKEHSRRIAKLFEDKQFRSKRSDTYETDVDKPRDPEDLFQDISYYVKNRPGTNDNRDLSQAALVRAGLERIFLSPNIETVRRYGSNFNPLVPDPLLFAALRSAADN